MLRCPSCSEPVTASARFCPACGSAISSLSQMPTVDGTPARPVSRSSATPQAAQGFSPGTILRDRYRIISLLGSGGMGEVYRADDLTLGQPVALKFLRRAFAGERTMVERFHAEVRNARQVAHPNVCRVFDVGDFDGQIFLSMEYVHGEDLATLLRRIGRLPPAKALEIAQQLCAGLAAAHQRAVLHRDLKPSNIMIDGHGHARITDFGLAVQAGEATAAGEIAGTPAYMSPEQTEGKPATAQSDLYSLGLILYEVFTGQRALVGNSFAEWRKLHTRTTPRPPSAHTPEIDRAVERAILSCLEKDPAKRPASALRLAQSLPGVDALAAAVAAGATPSPEMVAAAGEGRGLTTATAWILAGALAASVVAIGLLNSRTMLVARVQGKSLDALAERAQQIAERWAPALPPVDSVSALFENHYYVQEVQDKNKAAGRWNTPEPEALTFWYRQSPSPLVPLVAGVIGPAIDSPPIETPGEVNLHLNAQGRVLELVAVPPDSTTAEVQVAVDWNAMLSDAGYAPGDFTPALPQWTPPVFASERKAWQARDAAARVQRIEAASHAGKVVYFSVVTTWSTSRRQTPLGIPPGIRVWLVMTILTAIVILVAGTWFALRNYRRGRGDAHGAIRVAVASALLFGVAGLVSVNHTPTLQEVAYVLVNLLSTTITVGVVVWVLYMALEPMVRRRWPSLLITWTRLLSGAWRDPRLGADVLIGCVVGALLSLLVRFEYLVPEWFGIGSARLLPPHLWTFSPGGFTVNLLNIIFSVILGSLTTVFFLAFFRGLLRTQWAALIALIAGELVIYAAPRDPLWAALAFGFAYWSIALGTLLRWGLTACAAAAFVTKLLDTAPFTLQNPAWYSSVGRAGVLCLVVLAVYGFVVSLAGKPLFGAATLDD